MVFMSGHIFITGKVCNTLFSLKVPSYAWHQQLGHPSTKILQHTLNSQKLPCSLSLDFFCNSYLCNKSHCLRFSISTLTSHHPLYIYIYFTLMCGGVSSVPSYNGFIIMSSF